MQSSPVNMLTIAPRDVVCPLPNYGTTQQNNRDIDQCRERCSNPGSQYA